MQIDKTSLNSTDALSSMFLWVVFGFLITTVNCDLQRFVRSNPLVLHIIGLTTFFFLFTVIDQNNNRLPIGIVWLKTVVVYILFVLLTKSKWCFLIPVLLLLLTDQTLKKDLLYREVANGVDAEKERRKRIERASDIINLTIVGLILIGNLHYLYLQKLEYKDKFNLYKFFVGSGQACKVKFPNYNQMKLREAA